MTAPTDPTDIVERLRKIADAGRRADGSDIPLGMECREAADTITDLRRQLDEARERNLLANNRADNLHADLEKAREDVAHMKSERLYIIGANDGWEEAVEQIAVLVEQADRPIPNRQELAARIRSLGQSKGERNEA